MPLVAALAYTAQSSRGRAWAHSHLLVTAGLGTSTARVELPDTPAGEDRSHAWRIEPHPDPAPTLHTGDWDDPAD